METSQFNTPSRMKKNKEQYSIEEVFRKKMENHEVQADFSDWDIIRQRIPQRLNRTKRRIQFISSIAASIVLIIISLYVLRQNEESQLLLQEPFTKNVIQTESESVVSKQENATNEIIFKRRDTFRLAENFQLLKDPDTLSIKIPEISKDQDINSNSQTKVSTEETIEKNNEPAKTIDLYQQKTIFNPVKISRKNEQKWLLAYSVGTSSAFPGNSQFHTATSSQEGNSSNSDHWSAWGGGYLKSSKGNDWLDNNADVTHLPPFSFGLTVRKQLNPRFGIETGLVYTYLSSTYKWKFSENKYKATQQLHYIGIPINGMVTLWNNPKWSTYASAGVMIEKGIRRKMVWDKSSIDLSSTIGKYNNIDGLQWSLNSSVGINYHISKEIGVYFEPRLSYYFDNNQPKSIRTDCPVSVGFGIGMQYSF